MDAWTTEIAQFVCLAFKHYFNRCVYFIRIASSKHRKWWRH